MGLTTYGPTTKTAFRPYEAIVETVADGYENYYLKTSVHEVDIYSIFSSPMFLTTDDAFGHYFAGYDTLAPEAYIMPKVVIPFFFVGQGRPSH